MSGPGTRVITWLCMLVGIALDRWLPLGRQLSLHEAGVCMAMVTVALGGHWLINKDWSRRRPMSGCDCEFCETLRRR